ncbi:MAG: hypothetical protein JWL92_216 [Candidatus Nomurabacteria bacterium]|nr:hypothetical protein [Candidatus Nomurabacteria bacterium]
MSAYFIEDINVSVLFNNFLILMTTVINTPGNNDSGSGFGIVVIIILILVGGFLIYRYGWHHTAATPAANINVTVPTGTSSQ